MTYILHKWFKQNSSGVKLKFSILEWMFWATFSAYYPLLVVYLRSKEYTSTTIGIILAVNSIMIVIGQPFWGMVSDRLRSIKKVFVLCLGVTICLLLSVPLYKGLLITATAFAIITFFETGMVPLLDNWIIQSIKSEKGVYYGSIRLWGSLGFTAFVYIINVVIDHTSINSMFVFFAVLGTGTVLWSFRIQDQQYVSRGSEKKLKVGRLFQNREYVVFLIFSVMIFIPMRASFIFLPNLVDVLGGGQKELGISMAAMSISEVPVFFFSGRLFQRWKPKQILLVSGVFFILRQILYYFSSNAIHLIGIQALQGITFGLFLAASVYYIDALAPEGMKSTAQTLATAIYIGIGGVIGSFGGGWIIDALGIRMMYVWGSVLSITAMIFFLTMSLRHKSKALEPALEQTP